MADFSFVIPLQKDLNGNSLTGIASTTSVDRDDERMSSESLKMMVTDIKTAGVNLFGNHEHNWENTLGYIKDAELVDNKVQIKIDLDDPSTNPKIPMLLNKLKRGINLGLSVGGNVISYKWDYDKASSKKVKVLDRVKIYEVSVVGIPANADSYLSIPGAIAKSFKKSLKSELDELKREQDEYTTSDLQGVVMVIARKYKVDDDECLEYIYDGNQDVFRTKKSCKLCYSKINNGVCSICLAKSS